MNSTKQPLSLFLALLLWGSFSSSSWAARKQAPSPIKVKQTETKTKTPLKLAHLLHLSRKNYPPLKVAYLKWQASQPKVPLASALPDPQILTGLKNVGFGRLSVGKEMMSGMALAAMQKLPFPSKLNIASHLAKRQVNVLEWAYLNQTQKALTKVKLNYFQLYYIQKSLRVNTEVQILLQQFINTVNIKYAVGKVTQQDVLRSHVELLRLKEQRIQLLKKQKLLKIKLGRLTGLKWQDIKGRTSLPPWKLPSQKHELNSLSNRSALLQKESYKLKKSELKIDLAKSAYYPDFNLSGSYFNRGGLDPIWEFKWGASLPIYTRQKQDNQLAIARLEKEKQTQSIKDIKNDLSTQVQRLYINAETERELYHFYRQELIPQAQATFDASLAAYLGNKVDYLMVLNNLKGLFKYKLEIERKQVNAYQALAKIQNIMADDISLGSPSKKVR